LAGYIGKGKAQSLTDVPDVITHDVDVTGTITTDGLISSGNVGIGTTSPAYKLDVASPVIQFGDSTDAFAQYKSSAGNWHVGANSQNAFAFYSGTYGSGIERMRIDSNGNLLVGKDTTSLLTTNSSESGLCVDFNSGVLNGVSIIKSNATWGTALFLARTPEAGTGAVGEFVYNGSTVGTIGVTSSATYYNTSSDYRLKEDWQPMADATNRVKALNPVNFAWKVDGSRVDGFLAHEVQEVIPEAVTGTKDAMRTKEYEVSPAVLDDEGNVVTEAVMGEREVPDYQGIDQSKLVPLLTAALQEALTRIETLEAEVATLKGGV
jgi:hypothetical protein